MERQTSTLPQFESELSASLAGSKGTSGLQGANDIIQGNEYDVNIQHKKRGNINGTNKASLDGRRSPSSSQRPESASSPTYVPALQRGENIISQPTHIINTNFLNASNIFTNDSEKIKVWYPIGIPTYFLKHKDKD